MSNDNTSTGNGKASDLGLACEQCGKSIATKRRDAKFCGDACRKKANRIPDKTNASVRDDPEQSPDNVRDDPEQSPDNVRDDPEQSPDNVRDSMPMDELGARRLRKGLFSDPKADAHSARVREAHTDALQALNERFMFVTMGARSGVIDEKTGEILSRASFIEKFENDYLIPEEDKKPTSRGRAWLAWPSRRQCDYARFRPDITPAEAEAQGFYNWWRGFAVEPSSAGSCWLLKRHLIENICGDDAALAMWIWGWFAHIFQHPAADDKTGVSLVLRSTEEGTGKSILVDALGYLLGKSYLVVRSSDQITGRFTGHLERCRLLHAEEAFWQGDRSAESSLKSLITHPMLSIERKGFDAYSAPNYVNFAVTSNHDWVAPVSLDNRRWAVVTVPGHKHTQDRDYFGAIIRELKEGGYARLLYEMLTFDAVAKCVDINRPPSTGGVLEQKVRGLEPFQVWLVSYLQTFAEERELTKEIVRASFRQYCEDMQIKPIDPVRFGLALRKHLGPGITGDKHSTTYKLPSFDAYLQLLARKMKVDAEDLRNLLDGQAPSQKLDF